MFDSNAVNYSARNSQVLKPPPPSNPVKKRSKPGGFKIGGLSLDIDEINKEHDEKEKL